MAIQPNPDQTTLRTAFEQAIYSSDGSALPFSSLFDNHTDCSTPPERILVIFIRHFFCGNCQEYVRRLSSPDSPFHPSHRAHSTSSTTNFSKPASRPLPSVVVIGPGMPTLIPTYMRTTQCAFPVYSDPSTRLYEVFGMHRTLSLGHKAPGYIQHSLFSGAVKSAFQIVRRVGNGDATGGGDWNLNGGEFLFTQPGLDSASAKSHSPSSSAAGRASSSPRSTPSNSISNSSSSSTLGWEVTWCHRMVNSRDHTELMELHYNTCFSTTASGRAPSPPRSILVKGSRQAQPQRSHTFPLMTNAPLQRSYSSECLGACPGPDVPRSREQLDTQSSQSSAIVKGSASRSRSRSTSAGNSKGMIDGLSRPRSANSRPSNHQRNDSKVSATGKSKALPLKSLSESFAKKVGQLVRSKSVSGKPSPTRSEVSGNSTDQRPSTRSSTSQTQAQHRPRISLSLSRTKSISRSNMELLLPTNADSIARMLVPKQPLYSNPPSALEALPASNSTSPIADHQDLVPAPLRPRPRSRSRSRSQSASRQQRPTSPTRKTGEIEMDENGIMIVDGVEFVNVISVQARVDTTLSRKEGNVKPAADATAGKADLPMSDQQGAPDRDHQQYRPRPLRLNQGYTRGSVGLDLLMNRSTAAATARLALSGAGTESPSVGKTHALPYELKGLSSGVTMPTHIPSAIPSH